MPSNLFFWAGIGRRSSLGGSGSLAGLAASAKLVESVWSRAQMRALVKTTLVADDFAGVESGAAPTWGFCGMTVEAAPTKILCLFGGSIISVHDRKRCMGVHEGGWMMVVMEAPRRAGAEEGGLGGYNYGGGMGAVDTVEFMNRGMGRCRCG